MSFNIITGKPPTSFMRGTWRNIQLSRHTAHTPTPATNEWSAIQMRSVIDCWWIMVNDSLARYNPNREYVADDQPTDQKIDELIQSTSLLSTAILSQRYHVDIKRDCLTGPVSPECYVSLTVEIVLFCLVIRLRECSTDSIFAQLEGRCVYYYLCWIVGYQLTRPPTHTHSLFYLCVWSGPCGAEERDRVSLRLTLNRPTNWIASYTLPVVS